MTTSKNYQHEAITAVQHTILERHALHGEQVFPDAMFDEDFYVVWFAKTLQNWKALVSTDLVSGQYFEVTYNGDRNEVYVDWYEKKSNTVLSDTVLNPYIHLTD